MLLEPLEPEGDGVSVRYLVGVGEDDDVVVADVSVSADSTSDRVTLQRLAVPTSRPRVPE
jgi:hypothetical protein